MLYEIISFLYTGSFMAIWVSVCVGYWLGWKDAKSLPALTVQTPH